MKKILLCNYFIDLFRDIIFKCALIKFENTKLALVIPDQHPPHIAIKRKNLEKYGSPVKHRDGSESVYVDSPDENTFELIRYPSD